MQYFSSWKMKSNSMQTENFGRDFQVQIYLKNLLLVEAHEIVGMQHLTLLSVISEYIYIRHQFLHIMQY